MVRIIILTGIDIGNFIVHDIVILNQIITQSALNNDLKLLHDMDID